MSIQDDGEHHGIGGAKEAAFSDPETLCAEIEAYIAEKPFQSLLMAVLGGIVVGKIIL